jgi:hypothetical protein
MYCTVQYNERMLDCNLQVPAIRHDVKKRSHKMLLLREDSMDRMEYFFDAFRTGQ